MIPIPIFLLMSDSGEMWMLHDSEELRSAFYANGQNVHIDRKVMDSILQKYNITESTFYLSLGGYMKLPNIGGGGSLHDNAAYNVLVSVLGFAFLLVLSFLC